VDNWPYSSADVPACRQSSRPDRQEHIGSVSFVVSFGYVQNHSTNTTQRRQPRSRTLSSFAEPRRTGSESVEGGSRSQPARERPSDEMSDNRHRQRWTPADTHGQSAAGHTRCGAGSPRRNLASGRRGQRAYEQDGNQASHTSPRHLGGSTHCELTFLTLGMRPLASHKYWDPRRRRGVLSFTSRARDKHPARYP